MALPHKVTTGVTTRVHKYQGTGNDFIILDERGGGVKAAPVDAARAAAWCDRHFGVGGDGVLTVLPPVAEGSHARMHIRNADGSVPEMCGNGLRCVALFLADHDGASGTFTVDTDAGPRGCTVEATRSGDGLVTLSMGKVTLGAQGGLPDDTERVLDGKRVRWVAVNVGNPHLVMDAPMPSTEEANRLGSQLVHAEGFPQGTNVEWLVREGNGLRVLVYERGVGLTLACGTGAVASAYAAQHWGWVDVTRPGGVCVAVPGGDLWIGQGPDGQATLKGPARRVFTGELG